MNTTQLLEHFDRLSEAPDAVPRLRRFILDLAVRGKLVEQDAGDEPAAELLMRIQTLKRELIFAKLLKKSTTPLDAMGGETPFALPNGWAISRLGDVYDVRDGTHATPKYVEVGFPLVTSKNLSSGRLDFADVKLISKADHEEISQRSRVARNDILFAMIGSIGNPVIVDSDRSFSIKNVALFKYYDAALSNSQFLLLFLRQSAVAMRTGATGGLQPFVSLGMLRNSSIPLPPLAEQYRIVAKVDELMALCDQLEAAQQERERRRDRLAAASLQRLNRPAADTTPEAQCEHARFHLHHLSRLTTRPEHIKAMRQTILNLAVRGKLLEQDANDEPATKLLKRIQAEKARLAKLGRIKVEKTAEPIDQAGGPIPSGWALCRWNSIAMKIGDIDHLMPETVVGGVPYVSPRDFYPNNVIDFESAKRISRVDYLRLAAKIKPDIDDLIYPRYGTIGENRLVSEQREFLASYSCAVVKTLTGFVDPKYQYIFSISGYCKDQAKAAENKTTQANVGIASIQQYIVPLPPLAEQHRIVAKVDELMALCDQLETQLNTTQTDSRRLLEAVLDAALVK